MAKTLRRILIAICGAFALLVGGVFFVGCGEDYSKINLVTDVSSINLEIGESRNIYVTFENYQNGFNTQLTTSSGLDEAVFAITSQKVVSNNRVQITITGVDGGKDELTITSWDTKKKCTVNIFVNKYSSVLSQNERTFYVSNTTSLLPDANNFIFSPNTQNYDMTYYYMENSDVSLNFATSRLETVEAVEGDETEFVGTFVWSSQQRQISLRKFDEIKLVKQTDGRDMLEIYLDGQLLLPPFLPTGKSFQMLSVYDHSFEVDEDRKLFCVSPVYVMPDIQVEISGGYYYIDNSGERHLLLEDLPLSDKNEIGPIMIVPNNLERTDYILKVVMNQNDNFQIEFGNFIQSLENIVDISIFNPPDDMDLEKADNILYIKISQNAKTSAQMNFSFDISYDQAQGIEDASVSKTVTCNIVTKVAPNDITVNGLLGDVKFMVYNYSQTGYGEEALYLDVISGFATSPDFEGLFFRYDENFLKINHKNKEVRSGVLQKLDLDDLNTPFMVQGVWDADERKDVELEIYVVSDVLQNDDSEEFEGKQLRRTGKVTFDVVGGAHNLLLEGKNEFYVDFDAGTKQFFTYVFADSEFKSVNVKHSGSDVVDIKLDTLQIYDHEEGTTKYYLRLLVTPKAIGDGFYKLQLDNGTEMADELHFYCLKTLTEKSITFQLSPSDNENVTNPPDYSKTEDVETLSNVLNLEILNKSDEGGSEAFVDIYANVNEINGIEPTLQEGSEGVLAKPTFFDGRLRLRTIANGEATVLITLRGVQISGAVGEEFVKQDKVILLYVNVISYSLVDDFFLMNGGDYALVNNVYYGSDRIPFDDKQVKLSARVAPESAFAFLQYSFKAEAVKEFFENSVSAGSFFTYEIPTGRQFEQFVSSQIVAKSFQKEFIYFTAMRLGDTLGVSTSIYVDITKGDMQKQVLLEFSNGIMFYPEDEIVFEDEFGQTYTATFTDKTYWVDSYGTFNLDTLTYQDRRNSAYQIVLSSNISQRNQTKRYDARISSIEYQRVEYISLVSAQTNIDFSDGKLTQPIGVSLYPPFATNTGINVQFVTTNGNPYDGNVNEGNPYGIKMVEPKWDEKDNGTGIYTIDLSCQNFYDQVVSKGEVKDGTKLTGLLYIYPKEWADDYSSIPADLQPVILQVQYRNGTRENPYLIETYQDVLNINNEASLKSHYEIRTTIDMHNAKFDRPIGILGDGDNTRVVEFSGSIVGTTSQASIINLDINNSNFTKVVDGVLYSGLFAKIKSADFAEILQDDAGHRTVEDADTLFNNFTISGTFDLDLTELDHTNAYVGLLCGISAGKILNVAVNIEANSQILVKDGTTLHFGGMSGVNFGAIVQDFGQYVAGEDDGEQKFVGQNTKNVAYFLGTNDHPMKIVGGQNVYAGGVVGANSGVIVRREIPDGMRIYGYGKYTAYAQLEIINAQNVSAGGVAGVTAYADGSSVPYARDFFADVEQVDKGIVMKNLLVGGEVNALTVENSNVGGLVGTLDTHNTSSINIEKNTSRTFVRGKFVGGLVGVDNWKSTYDSSKVVHFSSTNSLESVDDGRSPFYAAQVISTNQKFDSDLSSNKNIMIGKTSLEYVDEKGVSSEFSVATYNARNHLDKPTSPVTPTNASTEGYYGDFICVTRSGQDYSIGTAKFFDYRSSSIDFGASQFEMPLKNAGAPVGIPRVFFAFLFDVNSTLGGERASLEDVADLNIISPTQVDLYPFVLNSEDITINSETSNLGIDLAGNLTMRQTGIATVRVTSILNTVQSQTIYLWIVNYFNRNVSSIFYTTLEADGVPKTDGGLTHIYGNSYSHLYLRPSYQLDSTTINGDRVVISSDGVVLFQGVAYNIVRNTQLGISKEQDANVKDANGGAVVGGDGLNVPAFSNAQIRQQTISFYKKNDAQEGYTDHYTLVPVLEQTIAFEGKEYTYLFELTSSKISLDVRYHETATNISVGDKPISFSTNGAFDDIVTIESTRDEELLFYDILGPNRRSIQSRMPSLDDVAKYDEDEAAYLQYLNTFTEDDLFKVEFERMPTRNTFKYRFSLNVNSTKYLNRFKESIFGEYVLVFYSSELDTGVAYCEVPIHLDEETLDYAMMTNYSNWEDVSVSDNVVVPSKRGLLEISLNPVDSVFDTLTLSNNAKNSGAGATNAVFEFVYQKVTVEGVEYVRNEHFGHSENGGFWFTYQELVEFYENLHKSDPSLAETIYYGKVFISYVMPSRNVDDNVTVAFDLTVTHGNAGDAEPVTATIELTTKLSSYAKMTIDDKNLVGDAYYVARGMSYAISLDYFGFSEDDIEITSDHPENVQISKEDRTLTVLSNPVRYPSGSDGLEVKITTHALREVEGVVVESIDEQIIYVMEFVLEYNYEVGVFEDIVYGMQNGVINVAIGNPFELRFSIRDFLEYNPEIDDVNLAVDDFVESMTSNILWRVFENGEFQTLRQGFEIKSQYYNISSFVFTPIKIYNHSQDIYHFTAMGHYTMSEGKYVFSSSDMNTSLIYTEFAFDVHEQSTDDNPIPVETYEELMNMQEEQYYILLSDIYIPNDAAARVDGLQKFEPISNAIAGLDGNSYSIFFGGTYDFSELETNYVGLFETVANGALLRNVKIQLETDVEFRFNTTSFNVGMLAGTNQGVITNCEAEFGEYSLTVTNLNLVNAQDASSTVAGLVATNSGYITNSRSSANIFASANLSGFVGSNSRTISSSYFRGGRLKNLSNNAGVKTAGLVINNTSQGEINTSYVSGDLSDDYEVGGNEGKQYYDGTANLIESRNSVAGFVSTNSGNVANCYTNIALRHSGQYGAGFVLENSGLIRECFSTSVLESYDDSSFGFAMQNSVLTEGDGGQMVREGGTITDTCFFLSQAATDSSPDINVSIGEINEDENTKVRALDFAGFRNLDNFEGYTYVTGRKIDSVWFYNEEITAVANFNGKLFNTFRLELVAPNIVATSKREFFDIQVVRDPETGAEYNRYLYVFDSSLPALGSLYNPIVIRNAEDMEDYITQENDRDNYNFAYYRLAADIDYSSHLENSKTFNTKFMGYFEGNSMTISNQRLVSDKYLTFAGLFAEVGSSQMANAIGTVLNFDYEPSIVHFANASVVGGIAGKLDGGTIANVEIDGSDGQEVVGNNIVGGAVGLTLGRFKIQNVNSHLSARARFEDPAFNNFDKKTSSFWTYSFAGSLVGVLSGDAGRDGATLSKCQLDGTAVSVTAAKAGLLFGLIDEDVTVFDIYIKMQLNMVVNAHRYGGLVAGESKGVVNKVVVEGADGNGIFTNFQDVPRIADAVGGFAGLLSGGSLTDITMSQSISVSTESNEKGIKHLGAIAGEISGDIVASQIYVDQVSLIGFQYVGGFAGLYSATSGGSSFSLISITNCNLRLCGVKLNVASIGGLIALVKYDADVQLLGEPPKNASGAEGTEESAEKKKSTIDIVVSSMLYDYDTEVYLNVGTIVGMNGEEMESSGQPTNISVKDTTCKMVSDAEQGHLNIVNLALPIDTKQSCTVRGGKDDVVQQSDNEYIKVYKNTAENTTYEIDLTFSYMKSDRNLAQMLNVSVYRSLPTSEAD